MESVGGCTFLRDLSVSMLGDEARFAAREWTEVAVTIDLVSYALFRILKNSPPFFFKAAVFAIVNVLFCFVMFELSECGVDDN